jgi:hypothetical protein
MQRMRSDFGIDRTPVASRIARARKQAGFDSAEVANALGVEVASYEDLESYDEEAFMCTSLGQVRALGGILGVSPRELVPLRAKRRLKAR